MSTSLKKFYGLIVVILVVAIEKDSVMCSLQNYGELTFSNIYLKLFIEIYNLPETNGY